VKQVRMIALGFAIVMLCSGHAIRVAAAAADATTRPFALTLNSPCAGEVIAISGTVHLVNRPGNLLPEHASWSSTGIGMTTGTLYRVVSSSNLRMDSDEYLTHLTITAPRPDGITATMTFVGPFLGVPEFITQHCN
jgi:hypothetical protein